MSWIFKAILRHRDIMIGMEDWNDMKVKYSVGKVYQYLKKDEPDVGWKHMLSNTIARSITLFTMGMTCHRRLATKVRLKKLGFTTYDRCKFDNKEETIDHLLFQCPPFKICWQEILGWMGIQHTPCDWQEELNWIITQCKGKGWRKCLLRSSIAETIYKVWKYRNNVVFGNTMNTIEIRDVVIFTLANREWVNTRMRHHITNLLID
ncbi:unnamed protein product [Lathyrus sativus]|nr:unnamed protein product [Lathyrus sativus]